MTCFEPDLKGEVTYLKDFEIGKSIIGISAISGNAMALIARDRANTDYIYFLECQTPPHDWYVSISWKTDEKLLSVHLSDDGLLLYTLSESRLSSYVPDPFDGILQRRWTIDLAHGEKHCTAIPNTGGAMIALGSSNGTVTVYLSGGTRAWSTDLSSIITALAFSNSGDLLAVGCSTGDLHIYTGHGDPVLTRKFDKSIYSLAFSPGCTNIVVGFEDGTTQIFGSDLGAPPLKTSTFVCPARHVSFSRSGETILICLDRKLVLIDHCNVVWAGLPTRDRESALTLLGAALSADSSYCIATIKRGNTADCLRFYSIKLPPQMLIREAEAEACIKEGTTLFQRKKYVEAFDCFVRAEKLSEPSLFTAFCKGESLFHLDELKRANEFYRECLGFNNTNARSIDACIMRGITALRLNNEDLAYAAFSDAERLSPPNDSTARYLLTLVQYRKSKGGEMSCPAPIDDYSVDGIPVNLASFIPSVVPNKYKKCFIMPCYSDEAGEIPEKKMFTTQVSKSIDTGYNVGKGDAGLIYNVDSDSLVGVFEAHSFPRIGPPSCPVSRLLA
ncbi:WD40 repeat domain-containing protein [Methanoculleus chikugoensis]|uniref:WD40 repeat domain-containing protein n=1 Tax=Methanoculleus chikugoensis TaxID=118126 RepID=UPI000B17A440|nr:WD40 repeat domain-containing protein [Methanoculleus chikugoensis]